MCMFVCMYRERICRVTCIVQIFVFTEYIWCKTVESFAIEFNKKQILLPNVKFE